MKNNAIVVTDRTSQIDAAVKALTKSQVFVGIPASKAKERPKDENPKINNAVIGYLAERGSPANNLPSRAWLVPGIKRVQDRIASIFRTAGKAALEGNLAAVEKGYEAAGLIAQVECKKGIRAGIPPPLRPRTIARRVREGFKGVTPYLRSGQFYNAISYVIRKK